MQFRRVSLLVLGLLVLALVVMLVSKDNLFSAINKGKLARVRKLVEDGCSIDRKTEDGGSVLHLVAQPAWPKYIQPCPFEDYGEMAACLIAHGADVDARDRWQQTPLHLAAFFENLPVAEVLLANGANVNAQDVEQVTPMHRALAHTDTKMANLLIDNGADLNAQDKWGRTALLEAFYIETGIERIEFLVRKDADINIQDGGGNTALHYAVRMRSLGGDSKVELAVFLIENGGDLQIQNKDGKRPPDVASREVRDRITKILNEQKAKVP